MDASASSEGPIGRRIWKACLDMHATGRTITRQELANVTNMKLSVVDDHVKRMKTFGSLRMIVPGVFEPNVRMRDDRPVTTTLLPNSHDPVRLQIGDTVIELSWREARNVGVSLAGVGLLFKG